MLIGRLRQWAHPKRALFALVAQTISATLSEIRLHDRCRPFYLNLITYDN